MRILIKWFNMENIIELPITELKKEVQVIDLVKLREIFSTLVIDMELDIKLSDFLNFIIRKKGSKN